MNIFRLKLSIRNKAENWLEKENKEEIFSLYAETFYTIQLSDRAAELLLKCFLVAKAQLAEVFFPRCM